MADPDCSRFCLGVCKWNPREMWCDDTRVQRLGSWDPIPLDYYWPDNAYLSPPPDFGAYPTEQQPDQSYTPGPGSYRIDDSTHGWGP